MVDDVVDFNLICRRCINKIFCKPNTTIINGKGDMTASNAFILPFAGYRESKYQEIIDIIAEQYENHTAMNVFDTGYFVYPIKCFALSDYQTNHITIKNCFQHTVALIHRLNFANIFVFGHMNAYFEMNVGQDKLYSVNDRIVRVFANYSPLVKITDNSKYEMFKSTFANHLKLANII
jgi:hypothetical protein